MEDLIFEPLAGYDLDLPTYANNHATGFDIPICLRRPCFEIIRHHSSNDKPYTKLPFIPEFKHNHPIRRNLHKEEVELWGDFPSDDKDPQVLIGPNETIMFPTGLKCQFPHGNVMHIYPRSSTGLLMLMLSNNVAVIDSDYRGQLFLVIWNRDTNPFIIKHGGCYAQGVIVESKQLNIKKGVVNNTERGSGGFGSTK